MRSRLVGALLLLWHSAPPARAAAQSVPRPAPPAAVGAPVLVLDHVTVIDVAHGTRLADQRVVIAGARIQSVGAAGRVPRPQGARVVDARGRYLIPGLWDMHVHPKRLTDVFYPLLVANGITGIRDAGSSVPLDTLRRWRQDILIGARVGPPRQLLSGPALDDAKTCPLGPERNAAERAHHLCIDDPAKVVDSLKAAGADIIKTYDLPKATFLAVVAEARRVGLPVGGHVEMAAIPAVEASDSGVRIFDHLQTAADLGELCLGPASSVARCAPLAARFRRNGSWVVPTLSVVPIAIMSAVHVSLEGMGPGVGFPKLYGPRSQVILRRLYRFSQQFWTGAGYDGKWLGDSMRRPQPGGDTTGGFAVMRQAGVPILAGTDNDIMFLDKMAPGFTLHAELALMVAEGLTPLEALQSATLNPAKFLRGTDSLGTVAPGKLADLVLLDADPLADITNTTAISGVVANGRYYDRAALRRLLDDGRARFKERSSEPRDRPRVRITPRARLHS